MKAQGGAKQKKKGSNGTGGISATSIYFYINRYLYITANERFFFFGSCSGSGGALPSKDKEKRPTLAALKG